MAKRFASIFIIYIKVASSALITQHISSDADPH